MEDGTGGEGARYQATRGREPVFTQRAHGGSVGRNVENVVYTAVERFGPELGPTWTRFVAWSRLSQLREVVSLDQSLCPNLVHDRATEASNHDLYADWRTYLYRDLEHVVARVAGRRANVLAVIEEPSPAALASFHDPRFDFAGFDLIDEQTHISALSNCEGFDKAFSPDELSPLGLIAGHPRAIAVRELLLDEYPDNPHADCGIWAIWRMKGSVSHG